MHGPIQYLNDLQAQLMRFQIIIKELNQIVQISIGYLILIDGGTIFM